MYFYLHIFLFLSLRRKEWVVWWGREGGNYTEAGQTPHQTLTSPGESPPAVKCLVA